MENVPVNGLLGRQVLMPTPRVEGFDAGAHRGNPDLWPTPKSNEHTGPGIHGNGGQDLRTTVAVSGMKLNSAWVQRMMGYPDGWLILDGEETR